MSKQRILVVDDDAWILRMVTTVLEKRGYEVETACDGEEALEKAKKQTPALLITDVMMPHMDGWSLVKTLRGLPEFSFVPVIFLTALGSDDDRIKGFRLGADDYLPKPFRFEELDLRVAKTMERVQLLETATRAQIKASENKDNSDIDSNNSAEDNATLCGNLSNLGLSSLLVLLEMERKSGVLHLAQKEVEAKIYLRQGRVIAAEVTGPKVIIKADAIYHLLGWGQGEFSFFASEIEQEQSIDLSTTALLMEGARLIDEAAI